MIHKQLTLQEGHYATNLNCTGKIILLQLQDEFGQQVRVRLTREEADDLRDQLEMLIGEVQE